MSQFAVVSRKTGFVEEIIETRWGEELPVRDGMEFVHDPQRTVWIGAIWDGYRFSAQRTPQPDNDELPPVAREKQAAWEEQRRNALEHD